MISGLLRSGVILLALAAQVAQGGCEDTRSNTGDRPRPPVFEQPVAARPAPTQHLVGRARMLPLGVVPYDMAALPLVSPDGRFIATQFGAAPTLATRDAAVDSTVPAGTRIAVYRLAHRENATAELPLVGVLSQPGLLGRSCDSEGFIIEAPQENGSRWIGFVRWQSHEVQWIVQDEFVNAFAALGPDGRLAWSRRPVEGGPFELVVRIGTEEFTVGGEGADWVVPTWSETGDGLFAARIEEGELSAVYMQGVNRVMMLQSLQSIRLAFDSRVGHAVDMVSGQPAVVGDPQPVQPMLLFAHPAGRYRGVALWRPLRRGSGATLILDPDSYSAAIDSSGFAILAVRGGLDGYPLDKPETRITLTREEGVPRTTTSSEWPIVLLAPKSEQPRIQVFGIQAVALR